MRPPAPVPLRSAAEERRRARRVLDRVSFGPRPGEAAALAAAGAEAWLRNALAGPDPALPPLPETHADTAGLLRELRTLDDPRAKRRMSRTFSIGLAGRRLVSALAPEAPLHERMVDFWANHFSIFARKGIEPLLLPSFERDVVRRHALGRFEDLLLASARHPAMLFYLDNWRSASPDPGRERALRRERRRGRPEGLNENYARELLELHTLGVHGGYSQRDVEEVARAFTGWTLGRPRGAPRMRFVQEWHDDERKTVLGTRLPPGGGIRDGERVIALLAHHPSTAQHVAHKLAVRFLADDPPDAAVERGAARFLESGGDLRATLASLLLGGPELFDPAATKVKTPFELVVSSLRATGTRVDDPAPLLRTLRRLGHVPYQAPTPAGYPDTARHWVDPGAVLERTRFAFRVGAGRVRGARLAASALPDPAEILPPDVRPETARALATPGLDDRERVSLALASPEFQLR
jgi:uncharacterized protein (DUF1800 family)